MEYIKNTLEILSNAACIGSVDDAALLAEKELSKYAEITHIGKNTIGFMGDGDYTVMLAAHIDEVGFTVTDIDQNGFLTVSACGGIDLRHLPSRRVIIHGKEKIKGVFCSVPPHLKKDEISFDDIKSLKIDSLLGNRAAELISEGDFVTFDEKFTTLCGRRVTGKAIDNRAGVVCLLELAKRLCGKSLPIKVTFALTNEEELGLRGAKTAAFALMPDEAVAIDVTFGDAPDIQKSEAKAVGGGAMIGVAPILSKKISSHLVELAEKNGIPYDKEIMTSRTGTDGDVISVTAGGVATSLISVPIRNMHTPCEVADLSDIKAVCDLLQEYILSGGIKNG